jgi:hypothetical protein
MRYDVQHKSRTRRLVKQLREVTASATYQAVRDNGIWVTTVALKAERKVGLALIAAGAATFCGLVYVIAASG